MPDRRVPRSRPPGWLTDSLGIVSRRDILPLLALAAAPLLLLWRAAVGLGMLYQRDIHLIWWAEIEQFVRAVAQGAWPLWDPSYGCGQPMLAVPETQVLYPPQWLNLVVGPGVGYAWLTVGHVALSAAGMYLLARQLRVGRVSAFAGAGVWAFSGPLLSLVNVWQHFAGAAWIPWVTLWAERCFSTRRWRIALPWAATIALQILAGSGEMALMSGLLCVVLALRAIVQRRRSFWQVGGSMGLAFGLGAGMAAALWVPVLELVSHSSRSHLAESARIPWSLHPWSLLELVSPLDLNHLPLRAAAREAIFGGREPFLLSIYLGLPALVLGLAALLRRRPGSRLWGGVGLAAVAVALGSHLFVYRALTDLLPLAALFRYPTKALVLAAWAVALLAAQGMHSLMTTTERHRRTWAAVTLGVAGVVTAFGLWQGWLKAILSGPAVGLVDRFSVTVTALVALSVLLALPRRLRGGRALAVLVALVPMAELATIHRNLNPTVSPLVYRLKPPLVTRIEQDPGIGRLFVYDYEPGSRGRNLITYPNPRMQAEIRETPYFTRFPVPGLTDDEARTLALQLYLLPPLPGRWGLRTGLDEDLRGLFRRSSREFLETWRGTDGTPAATRMLRLAGITHVVALHDRGWFGLEHEADFRDLFYAPTHLFRVPDPLPRVFWVGRARQVSDADCARELLAPGFDPRREVLLASRPPYQTASPGGKGVASIMAEKADRLRIRYEAEDPGYLVILDSFDPGWKVAIDGRRAPLLRANLAFRAVAVPPGRHQVELRYRPVSVLLGLVLSLASLVLTVVLWRQPS